MTRIRLRSRVARDMVIPIFASALAVLTFTAPSQARESGPRELFDRSPDPREIPASPGRNHTRAVGDTLFYGYYNGATGLAIEGYPRGASAHTWTFDHGAPNPFEGWYATDLTSNTSAFFRRIDEATWAGGGNLVDVPLLDGPGSAWVGAFEDEADDLCWQAGLGYGNSWCQRLVSPSIGYAGGGATLTFEYFNDTEPDFDYTRVLLRRPNGDEVSLNFDGFTDQIGLAGDHPASPPVGVLFVSPVSDLAVGPFASFQLIFEMESDGGWSDQDGSYATEYGAFAADNVTLTGGSTALYGFDVSLEGWTAAACPGIGTFLGLQDVSFYSIQDPCACELSGNVLEFHDDSFEHPYGQHMVARSNPADLTGALGQLDGSPETLGIGALWDQYSELPSANGVFYRPGWSYFPYICPVTGASSWSPRVGSASFFFVGVDPLCRTNLSSATNSGVPGDVDQVRFLFELYASCDAFGIDPTDCSNVTNFTPVIDNINIFATGNFNVPVVSFENGRQFQDGFSQSFTLSPTQPGNADCTRNQNFGNTPPIVLEDVPQVNGPLGVTNPWTPKLHFRVLREGPGAGHPNFAAWQAWKTNTGVGVGDGSNFAFGIMDTLEIAGVPVSGRDRFVGYYREDDPNNPSPGTELVEANEIIVDNVPPGTQVQYFVSAKFNSGTNSYLLPDTSGGHFAEFEILPSWRNVSGSTDFCVDKFPAVLLLYEVYYNPFLSPEERYVLLQIALEILYGPPSILSGVPNLSVSAIDLRPWDRYDYLDPSSNWKAPFARGAVGANNGVSLPQLLGYRSILVDTGPLDFAGWPEDWSLMSDWLTAVTCDGNVNRQGLHMNGDGIGTILRDFGPSLLSNRLGAGLVSSAYNTAPSGGPDENFCVNLDAPGTALYGTSNSFSGNYTYDAWGNWCPNKFTFDVLGTQGTGVGNRVYTNIATLDETNYAQIANNVTGPASDNYRTVIDGVSWMHMSARSGPLGDPQNECSNDSASVATALFNEIAAGQEWIFGVGNLPALAVDPCVSVDAPDGEQPTAGPSVSRLVTNTPNPFNPRTVIRYSLAVAGDAKLRIYDTAGRLVRTLIDEKLPAGNHRVTWDGTNERGDRVPAGVYWSQLTAPDGYTSNKRMVVIR